MRRELRGDGGVVRRVADDADVRVVLRGRAQERRAADVDLLDRLRERRPAPRDGFLERVQVHDDEVDRSDAVRRGLAAVALLGAVEEDAAEELRVERLDAPAEDLRKAREVRDVRDGEARCGEVLRGAARRKEPEALRDERAGEFVEAGAVGDREEGEPGASRRYGPFDSGYCFTIDASPPAAFHVHARSRAVSVITADRLSAVVAAGSLRAASVSGAPNGSVEKPRNGDGSGRAQAFGRVRHRGGVEDRARPVGGGIERLVAPDRGRESPRPARRGVAVRGSPRREALGRGGVGDALHEAARVLRELALEVGGRPGGGLGRHARLLGDAPARGLRPAGGGGEEGGGEEESREGGGHEAFHRAADCTGRGVNCRLAIAGSRE